MENQPGPSSSGSGSGSEQSTQNKLPLTEENLDYLLRQEYTLSQMCFDADQMTLEALIKSGCTESLENVNNSDDEQGKQENISPEKMVVGQEDDSDSIAERTEDDKLRMKPVKEIFKLDVDGPGLVALYEFCQNEYGENAEYMWKEKLQEVWQAKKSMEEKVTDTSSSTGEDSEDVPMEAGNVSKAPIFLKIKDRKRPSSTDDSNPLNVNYCINDKIQIDNKWEDVSFIKYFVDEEKMEIPKEVPTSASINKETCQAQICPVPSTDLKKLGGLSTASEHTTSTQNDGLIAKKNTNDISSVRDAALASCSSQDIEFIDADEDCFESPMSEITFYKTDSEDSKKNKTLISSINKTRGNMLDLEDLLNTFTESTNLHIRNLGFDNVVPAKSSLKRKISQISNKKKVKMSGLKFTSVTIFYFERSQGFSSIPTKGGSTLGMEHQHFYISTIPIDEYEHRKVQKQQPNLRSSSIIYHKKSDKDKPKNVQALTLSQRIELLQSAEVQIEGKEEVDCAHIRSSRASAGCDCKEYCDPDVCCCSLSGIECQVDRPNFPCGCTRENCRNRMGRNEYNHNKVKTHFTKTMRKINMEGKGRTSKRKQASPSKVIVANPDITRDIDMIQI